MKKNDQNLEKILSLSVLKVQVFKVVLKLNEKGKYKW